MSLLPLAPNFYVIAVSLTLDGVTSGNLVKKPPKESRNAKYSPKVLQDYLRASAI